MSVNEPHRAATRDLPAIPITNRHVEARQERAVTVGAVALGALAIGALAIGAMAIGRLGVGKLTVGRAKLRSGEVDELRIARLTIG
jgi:hypothetical protein